MDAQSLTDFLAPFRIEAIAEAIKVDRNTASSWFNGRTSPHPRHFRALSVFLRIPLEQIAESVAQDSKRRSLARVSDRAAL